MQSNAKQCKAMQSNAKQCKGNGKQMQSGMMLRRHAEEYSTMA
jgi:hypothetical protein